MRIAIKRACLEWLTIGLASATVGLLALWLASVATKRTDFVFSKSPRGFDIPMELSLIDGAITISKNIDDPEVFDRSIANGAYGVRRHPFSLDLPGITLRRLGFSSGPTMWLLRFSLLFPTLMCAAITVGCFFVYRRAWRKWHAEFAKARAAPLT